MPKALGFIIDFLFMSQFKFYILLLATGLFFIGCNQKRTSVPEPVLVSNEPPTVPYAELQVAEEVFLDDLNAEESKKSVDIPLKNTGTDTLYIRNVLPECDCTEIISFDSIIPPGEEGKLTASLDAFGYTEDTLRKEIGILSNDRRDRVKRVVLSGICK